MSLEPIPLPPGAPLPAGYSIANRMVWFNGYCPTPSLIRTCNKCGRSFLQSLFESDFSHELPLIFTDGACINSRRVNPQAGCGVAMGANFYDKFRFPFSGPGQRTNQRAELFGVRKGLEMNIPAAQRRPHGVDCPMVSYSNFVIATDSHYAVQGITDWLPRWKANGFRTSDGRPPDNEAEFCEIDDTLSNYEAIGYEIAIWWIPRDYNVIAKELARQGARRDRGIQDGASRG